MEDRSGKDKLQEPAQIGKTNARQSIIIAKSFPKPDYRIDMCISVAICLSRTKERSAGCTFFKNLKVR